MQYGLNQFKTLPIQNTFLIKPLQNRFYGCLEKFSLHLNFAERFGLFFIHQIFNAAFHVFFSFHHDNRKNSDGSQKTCEDCHVIDKVSRLEWKGKQTCLPYNLKLSTSCWISSRVGIFFASKLSFFKVWHKVK